MEAAAQVTISKDVLNTTFYHDMCNRCYLRSRCARVKKTGIADVKKCCKQMPQNRLNFLLHQSGILRYHLKILNSKTSTTAKKLICLASMYIVQVAVVSQNSTGLKITFK